MSPSEDLSAIAPERVASAAGTRCRAWKLDRMSSRGQSLSMFVVQRTFSRVRRGYDPGEVDRHLELVSRWFTSTQVGEALSHERAELHERERRLGEREAELARALEGARLEADGLVDGARRRAEADAATAERALAVAREAAAATRTSGRARTRGAPGRGARRGRRRRGHRCGSRRGGAGQRRGSRGGGSRRRPGTTAGRIGAGGSAAGERATLGGGTRRGRPRSQSATRAGGRGARSLRRAPTPRSRPAGPGRAPRARLPAVARLVAGEMSPVIAPTSDAVRLNCSRARAGHFSPSELSQLNRERGHSVAWSRQTSDCRSPGIEDAETYTPFLWTRSSTSGAQVSAVSIVACCRRARRSPVPIYLSHRASQRPRRLPGAHRTSDTSGLDRERALGISPRTVRSTASCSQRRPLSRALASMALARGHWLRRPSGRCSTKVSRPDRECACCCVARRKQERAPSDVRIRDRPQPLGAGCGS